ncbi:MAG: hypothetical protein M5U01_02300 [Ardenticatenaceae bacterium]|nr:hypothetical protein [Ardenticatenaceae bacterium]
MNSRERVIAALAGRDVDRPPYALWRHFPGIDTDPTALAQATLAFARRWQIDLVKQTPNGLYAVEDWGVPVQPAELVGTAPEIVVPPRLESPSGWRELPALTPTAGALGRELEALKRVRDGLDSSVPVVMTIFSPLTLAWKLVGPRLLDDLHDHDESLRAGLKIIARSVADFGRAALDAGADGLFFATQLATRQTLAPADYTTFGEHFDEIVLGEVRPRADLLILHLHGTDIFFSLANDYPVDAVSWHDRETEPILATAMGLTSRGLVAGLDRRAFLEGPAVVRRQVRTALDMTAGRRLILAPSCVIPSEAPDEALQAVVDEVQHWATSL